MKHAKPLPGSLIQRYHGWKATTFNDNKAWYQRLANEGQRPRAMVIGCCDSRVNVNAIFGTDQGEFFIHRNVAGLVPQYNPDGDQHGTSAAVEYAVTGLHVSQIIVLGHSNCGGVQSCHEMCAGNAPHLDAPDSFVGRWMDILRPSYKKVVDIENLEDRMQAFERESVLVALTNLMTFPFVANAVEEGSLALHGLWTDIGEGTMLSYDPEKDAFLPL